jgi:dienelactone hydrolase
MKDMKIPMLIFMGAHDGFGEDPDAFKDALAASSKVELKIIDDADHFFEGEAETEMVKFACMYMNDIEKR